MYDTPFELSDEALARRLSRYGSVLGSSRFNPQGYEGIQNGIRVVRMQLSESVHLSYASAGESNTRERFLPEGSGIFPIMSQKCAPTWYALTAINWVTPSATVKKRPSAVFAKRTATTLSIVIYLSGGALKKIDNGDDAAASAPLPESRPSQPPLQPSSDESSSDGPPPSMLSFYRNLYLIFLLHNLL